MGALLGVVVATTESAARAAAKAVAVEYDELPALFDIDDAIAAESYIEVGRRRGREEGRGVHMGGLVCVCVCVGGL